MAHCMKMSPVSEFTFGPHLAVNVKVKTTITIEANRDHIEIHKLLRERIILYN